MTPAGDLKNARILVVDDEPQNVRYLQDVLEWAGYENVAGVADPLEVLERVRRLRPDLIVLDLLMPQLDGFAVMEAIGMELDEEEYLPILILTSDISRESRRRALSSGAKDFLTKPMSPTEVRFRVANLLRTRFLWLECERQRRLLETPAESDETSDDELLERWAQCIDAAAGSTEGHARRVAWTATRIANELGLSTADVELIGRSALLHDLGVVIASGVGSEAGVRSGEPGFEHPEAVGRLLDGCRTPVLRMAREIATAFHERWDGEGFPAGLVGEAIPVSARVVAAAHRFDELVSGPEELAEADALTVLEQEAGSRFEPGVVAALGRSLGIPVG